MIVMTINLFWLCWWVQLISMSMTIFQMVGLISTSVDELLWIWSFVQLILSTLISADDVNAFD